MDYFIPCGYASENQGLGKEVGKSEMLFFAVYQPKTAVAFLMFAVIFFEMCWFI